MKGKIIYLCSTTLVVHLRMRREQRWKLELIKDRLQQISSSIRNLEQSSQSACLLITSSMTSVIKTTNRNAPWMTWSSPHPHHTAQPTKNSTTYNGEKEKCGTQRRKNYFSFPHFFSNHMNTTMSSTNFWLIGTLAALKLGWRCFQLFYVHWHNVTCSKLIIYPFHMQCGFHWSNKTADCLCWELNLRQCNEQWWQTPKVSL